MKYHIYLIDKDYKNIYFFLKEQGFSENYITALRKTLGNFILNDNPVNIRQRLKANDVLKINSNPNAKTTIMQCDLPLDIVYEDEYYLLINKPSGISCMPNKSHYSYNLAGAICKYMASKDENFVLRIVNRLDKDTAGIIIVAKDSIAQNKLKEIDKTYHALCDGKIDHPITIDKPIKTISVNGKNERKRIISSDGQAATTFLKPLSFTETQTLIELKLVHGRTHQIRLHLSSINHPLIGDEIYGTKSEKISHTALVCKEISFFHPFLNEMKSFKIDYPEDFKNLL